MPHALFSPSATARWLHCPGSVGLSLTVPAPPSSSYADDGTRLHSLAEAYITNALARRAATAQRAAGRTDHPAPAPLGPISNDDWARIGDYCTFALNLHDQSRMFLLEAKLVYHAMLYGTADLLALSHDGTVLHIADLKTGAGILVQPEENDQMLSYAFMALNSLLTKIAPKIKTVQLTIAQPFEGQPSVRTWQTTVQRVQEHGAALLGAMESALAGGAPLAAGKHCRFCPAKAGCPELLGMAVELRGESNRIVHAPEQLGRVLDMAEQVETFIAAVRAKGHEMASRGVTIPGWTLKAKRASRVWSDEAQAAAIARAKRLRIFQPRKLMSPAMAEKAHANLPEEMRDLIVSVSSGTNLVRDSSVPAPVATAVGNLLPLAALQNLKHRI